VPFHLDRTPLTKDQYEADLSLLDRYQRFSAELLRLSLLSIGAIAFMAEHVWEKAHAYTGIGWIYAMALSAGAALAHRYTSTDGLANHIEALRLNAIHNRSESQNAQLDAARTRRRRLYKASGILLLVSSTAFVVGALFLASTIAIALGSRTKS
jgi:hypothetical protein